MMEQDYSRESVQELLSWAQETLQNKTYPEKLQLDKAINIFNCEKYLDSMISVISKNWENSVFFPTIDQLREVRSKIGQL